MSPSKSAIVESLVISAVGIIVVVMAIAPNLAKRPATEFACRWDGGCAGWTPTLAVWHALNDIGHFVAYIGILIALLRLHPIKHGIKNTNVTMLKMAGFVTVCAVGHLISAVMIWIPAYRFEAVYNTFSAAVSLWAWVGIAVALEQVFRHVKRNQDHADNLLRELAEIKKQAGKE